MERYELYMWGLKLTWLAFTFAFGACIGSLINVLVYRLPRGIGVVTPPSRCPRCDTPLTFRENLPIIGWILLRGRCRFCKQPISPEYPLVEAFVAVLFAAFYVLWYMDLNHAVFLGIDWGSIRPEWAEGLRSHSVPLFVLLLLLLGSLTAMTLVDARTFTIPLVLTWVPAILGLLVHVGTAVFVQATSGRLWVTAPGQIWALPTPVTRAGGGWIGNWPLIGASIGGVLGIGVGVLLLWTGQIRRSFADYAEWEAQVTAGTAGAAPAEPAAPPARAADASELWIQYPHARREVLKELLFLAPCLGLGMAGWYLGLWLAPAGGAVPLWLAVLSGVCLGYLIGGGVVWLVRILGSLAFGKEAMGLGDVHMMAAVGACLGWIDATLAFFLAAFVGLVLHVATQLPRGAVKRTLPYGPSLAVATVLVLLTKPLIEIGLTRLFGGGRPINLP